jgi:hypothetical protein
MSGKGQCYDDAYAESFLGSPETELGRRYESRSFLRQNISEHIEVFYNRIKKAFRFCIRHLFWDMRGLKKASRSCFGHLPDRRCFRGGRLHYIDVRLLLRIVECSSKALS